MGRSLHPIARKCSRAALGASVVALAGCGGDSGISRSLEPGGPDLACYANATQSAPNDGASVVTLDAAQRFQTMMGFGTTERLFDDPHLTETFDAKTQRAAVIPPAAEQSKILDALYVDLGLTRVRFHPGDLALIEPVNDNASPLVADLSKFDFSWKRSDGQLAMLPAQLSRGLTTFYGSPLALEKWMSEANPEEYAEWVIVLLKHWRDAGHELPYYSLKNEPGYQPGLPIWSGAYLRDVTKILGARMKAEGLKTKLVVPDDVSPAEAYSRLQVILADPEARQYVGAIGYHIYQRGGEDKIKQLGEQYGIPIWMTEFSTPDDWFEWAKVMHELIADDGVSAIDYMWGYFGDYDRSQLVRVLVRNDAYAGFERTRQYYVTGQYSKFVRPGAVRIAATSADPDVKATAYVDGAKLIVVATNVGTRDRLLRVELGSGAPCVTKADVVRTTQTDSWLSLPAASFDAPRFVATLPPGSVTTFVGRK